MYRDCTILQQGSSFISRASDIGIWRLKTRDGIAASTVVILLQKAIIPYYRRVQNVTLSTLTQTSVI